MQKSDDFNSNTDGHKHYFAFRSGGPINRKQESSVLQWAYYGNKVSALVNTRYCKKMTAPYYILIMRGFYFLRAMEFTRVPMGSIEISTTSFSCRVKLLSGTRQVPVIR